MAGFADRRPLRAALLLAGALGAVALAWPRAGAARPDIFSPGELSKPHLKLEGIKNCTQCHTAGSQTSGAHCLECHVEIKARVAKGEGFHGRQAPAEQKACNACHKEHQGRDFDIVDWGGPVKQFDHGRTGWALVGKHRKTDCLACHELRRIADPAVKGLVAKTKRKTFLGLAKGCLDCHFDEHRGQLTAAGSDCTRCHGQAAFTPVDKFNHDTSDFKLDGKHATVACKECHKSEPDAKTPAAAFPAPAHVVFTRYKPVAHAACTDCHKDVHEGKFGSDCVKCHATGGWRELKTQGTASGPRTFHDGTRFPLRGAHARVDCKVCHGPFKGVRARFKGLAFQRCADCHLDAHVGQLKWAGGPPQDCDKCHSEVTFAGARFDVEEHARLGFKLEGAHRAVACQTCHLREESLQRRVPAQVVRELERRKRPLRVSPVVFAETQDTADCRTCHTDAHAGQFDARVKAAGCKACHSVETFHAPAFDHAKDSRFPLEGKHAQVACARCHAAERPVKGTGRAPFTGALVRYRPVDTQCTACHADPHAAQFAAAPEGCTKCHSTAGWKELRFVHAEPFTAFALEGKHAAVACERCHALVRTPRGVDVRRYAGTPKRCEECHADQHQGAFDRFVTAGPRCAACHAVAGWGQVTFDHERTGFSLKGAHANTACSSCHGTDLSRALAQRCSACHRDAHEGEFGARCAGCHEETSWRPLFDADAHRRTNFPLTGRHATINCQECHLDRRDRSFTRATIDCAGCHQRDYDRTRLSGIDHAAAHFATTCRDCHVPWAWGQARFPAHEACFQIGGGPHAGIRCQDCHTSVATQTGGGCNTNTAACMRCHSCTSTTGRHREVSGFECKDRKCYECHRFSVQSARPRGRGAP